MNKCFLLSMGGLCLILNASSALADNNQLCKLEKLGDCCTVTIDEQHNARFQAAIDPAAQTDYVEIINDGSTVCLFGYDGAIKVSMRSAPKGVNGTWLGGDFALNYQLDDKGLGSCQLSVYFSNSDYDPRECHDGHYFLDRVTNELPASDNLSEH